MKRINSTNALTFFIILIAITVIFVGIQIKEYGFINEPYIYLFDTMLTFTVFFLMGCTGGLWVIRQEAPQNIQLKGKPAVRLGLMTMIGCWVIALYALFLLFVHYTSFGG
jgi:hypothetical protein